MVSDLLPLVFLATCTGDGFHRHKPMGVLFLKKAAVAIGILLANMIACVC